MECGVVGHNFERDHLRTIPAKCGLIWFSSFRGEDLRFRFVVFKAAFNNISVISWRSIVLVGGTGVLGENISVVICDTDIP
jgi:hypothetical protein